MVTLFVLLFLLSLVGGIGVSVYQTLHASDRSLQIKPIPALIGLVPAALFLLLSMSFVTVDAGNIGVVKRFGKVTGMLQPGMHFIRPVADSVTAIAVQRRIVKVHEAASSSDLQIVNIEVTLGYHLDPKYADFALQQLNDDAENRVIVPANLEAIKAQTALYEAQGLIKQREQVRQGIENDVRSRLAAQHIILEDMAITNFSFSTEYENAIEAKQVAEQNAEKARNLLEQTKIEAEQAAAKAKGEADARVAQAQGEAQSILVEAQAKAKAQELQKQNLTPELIQLRTIELLQQKWDGQFPQFYMGGGKGSMNPALLLNVPVTGKATQNGDGN